MDSKNNIGHSADISFTAELPIPIYNGNNSMDFEKLASLYKDELSDAELERMKDIKKKQRQKD